MTFLLALYINKREEVVSLILAQRVFGRDG